MPRCAFLTLDDPTGYLIDDELAYEPLHALGWTVEAVPWRSDVRWQDYDVVVIRSTWDYQHDPVGFLDALARIERAGVPLHNPLDLVRWNLDKRYLRDLAGRGVPIVPTVWLDRLGPGALAEVFDKVGSDEIVVKPVVSANAYATYRLQRQTAHEVAESVEAHFAGRALMAQPFVPAVVEEGEFSIFYFNGEYSHAILKTPSQGDFRVQEDHGGLIRAVQPSAALRAASDTVLAALDEPPLYARFDLVRSTADEDSADRFWLMEAELVEPALYFRMDEGSAARFAQALHRRYADRTHAPSIPNP